MAASVQAGRDRTFPAIGAVAAAFSSLGVFWGSWAVAATNIQHAYHLSPGGLGVLSTVVVGVGTVGNAAGGALAGRLGPRRTLALGAVGWAVLSACMLMVPGGASMMLLFALALAVAVGATGTVDATMNACAAHALAGHPRRLVRFHSIYNLGALAGSLLTGIALHEDLTWRFGWAVCSGLVLAIGIATARSKGLSTASLTSPAPATATAERLPAATSSVFSALLALQRSRLWALSAVMLATALLEGAISTWGVLYLREALAASALIGSAAYAAGEAMAATTRAAAAPAMGRVGALVGIAIGSGTAGLGLLLEALAPSVLVGGIGLALATGGISLCWPLAISIAARAPGDPVQSVAGLNTVGYLGIVIGPMAVGWTADTFGLQAGILLLVGVAAVSMGLIALARTITR